MAAIVKSGITKNISDYPWSSYHAYVKNNALAIIDTGIAMESFPNIQRFKEFMNTDCEDSCLVYNVKNKYTDEELYRLINEYLNISRLEVMDINSRSIGIKKNQGSSESQQPSAFSSPWYWERNFE